MTTRLHLIAIACLALTVTPRAGVAQQPGGPQDGSGGDLARLSIEDLLNVEVTTVSRREQRADTAPAAISVITQDDIRRSGIQTLPELFRLIPGVQVARVNANNWAIAVRGFNDVYSNKLLVLIDGRSIYNRAFSGTFWNAEDLALDEIDRIEVVRGPGGAIWGANAVDGVINIVTKPAAETQGAAVRVGVGTFDGTSVALRYGGKIGGGLAYRVSSQYADRDTSAIDRQQPADDGWNVLTNTARVDWERGRRAFMATGGYTRSDSHPLFTVLTSPLPEVPFDTSGRAERQTGFVLGRFTQTFVDGASLQLQSFYNHRDFNDPNSMSHEEIGDVDVEYHSKVGTRQDLVVGGGARYSVDTSDGVFSFVITPRVSRNAVANVFAQDEIALSQRVRVTLGSKLEHDTITGYGIQPTARVGWDVVPGRQHVWAAVSRALRTPSSTELGMLVKLASVRGADGTPIVFGLQGNPDYQAERFVDAEVGYRAKLHATVDVDVTVFRGHYANAETLEPQAPVFQPSPVPYLLIANQFANLLAADTTGVEAAAHWTPTRVWRLDASYSGFHYSPHPFPASHDETAPLRDGNAPEHQWQLHSTWWLGQRAEVNAALYHVGRLRYLDVPAYTRADLRFETKLARPLSLIIAGENLLTPWHLEYSGIEADMLATRIPRSGSVQLVWRLGTGS